MLGIGYNTELLAKKKLAAPACWKDLVKPEFAGEVQMANPERVGHRVHGDRHARAADGRGRGVQVPEGAAQEHQQLSALGRRADQGGGARRDARQRRFIHDVVTEAQAGFPVKSVAPCEGTGYEIGSLSIVKGARNLDNAKKFYDWALTPKAQALGAQAKQFQLPSNVGTPVSPLSPKIADIKLINYDFAKYGASAERKRLLERWDKRSRRAARSNDSRTAHDRPTNRRCSPVAAGCRRCRLAAQAQLNMYCSSPNTAWCQGMAVGFEKATGTKVAVMQKATGEMLAQIKAERANPKGDIWWAGAGRHLPAGGRRRPARDVSLAQRRRSSTTGRSASPTCRRIASPACTAASSRSATTPRSCDEEEAAGAEMLEGPAQPGATRAR